MVSCSSRLVHNCPERVSLFSKQLMLSFFFHRYTIFKDHVTLDDCILFNSLSVLCFEKLAEMENVYLNLDFSCIYSLHVVLHNHGSADEIHDGMNLELYYQ